MAAISTTNHFGGSFSRTISRYIKRGVYIINIDCPNISEGNITYVCKHHTHQTLWRLNRFTTCFEPVHGLQTGSHIPRVGVGRPKPACRWSQTCSPGHNICGLAQNVWSGLHHYYVNVNRFKAPNRSTMQLLNCEPGQKSEPAHNDPVIINYNCTNLAIIML